MGEQIKRKIELLRSDISNIEQMCNSPKTPSKLVGLSKLNFHKFKRNFRDTINPMCPTSDGIEDTEHFLLLCPTFDAQRRDLFAGIVELIRPFRQITDLSNDSLTQLFLYGDQDLSTELNRNILELTLRFIHDTGRFD